MAGFVIDQRGSEEAPKFTWFLDIDGREDAVARAYGEFDSEEEAVAAIRRLKGTDLSSIPIRSGDRVIE